LSSIPAEDVATSVRVKAKGLPRSRIREVRAKP
jgi:hypothetical protein